MIILSTVKFSKFSIFAGTENSVLPKKNPKSGTIKLKDVVKVIPL
jgi:hypothetical protein